jgi:hypothetical protein
MRKPVYFVVTSPSQWIQLTEGGIRSMCITDYSITGVPVTAGVPNSLSYNVLLEERYLPMVRNDSAAGYPLRLTGSFTTEHLDHPIQLIAEKMLSNRFKIVITDGTGEATFTQAAFWGYCEVDS